MSNWHNLKIREILEELETAPAGLSSEEAQKRFLIEGPNKLPEPQKRGSFFIFLRQFANFLTILLIVAFIVSLISQPLSHSIVLLAVILVNVFLGFYLEYKAERALQSLAKVFIRRVEVRRDGEEKILPTSQIVKGDIVILNQGDLVPADLRLIFLKEVSIDESALTGESVPSHKTTKAIVDAKVVSDQENMAFAGTTVVAGSAEGVVVTTGDETELGRIAETLKAPPEKTPLQKRLDYLGKILVLASIFAVLVVFIAGLIRGESLLFLFNYSVALLVSVVPESLPTVVTLALAIGVLKMAKNKAILRRLPSVETLATVNLICSDKTGTLSKNEMTAKILWIPGLDEIEIPGKGYSPEPAFDLQEIVIEKNKKAKKFGVKEKVLFFVKAMDYCNNSKLIFEEKKKEWRILGDPTEGALKVFAKKSGIKEKILEEERILEIPFTEARKRMSVVTKEEDGYFIYAKGAPEEIGKCSNLSEDRREQLMIKAEALASEGYRLLAFAYKKADEGILEIKNREKIEDDLNFLGMIALMDPPAERVIEAVQDCAKAKIRVMVISGDHKLTTLYFAKTLKLKDDEGREIDENNVMVGEELKKIDDEELLRRIDDIYVFARTTPMQKKKILRILKKQGHIVAMTGDGINDAPALKKSDVAIAMGKRGQEVAKEVSDIVLLDDNFATIKVAIEYARSIYDNIRKFLTFLLSGNFDELLLVLIAFVFGLPLPFTALQILWINLVTDSFPALALAFEEPRKDIIQEKPRDPKESVILGVVIKAFLIGSLAFVFGLMLFLLYLGTGTVKARTMVFTFSVFFELFVVFSIRSRYPFWQKRGNGLFSNKFLIIAFFISASLQLAVLYTPLSIPLETKAINAIDWLYILIPCFASFIILEIMKSISLRKKGG